MVQAAKLMVLNIIVIIILVGLEFSFIELSFNERIQARMFLHGKNSMSHVSAEYALEVESSDRLPSFKILMDPFKLNQVHLTVIFVGTGEI